VEVLFHEEVTCTERARQALVNCSFTFFVQNDDCSRYNWKDWNRHLLDTFYGYRGGAKL
jgi:hypothetical protein